MADKEEDVDFRVIDYPFHLGDLIGGTTHLDNAQFGAYMRLLFANIQAQAKKGGLDNVEAKLQSYSRCTPKQWQKLWVLIGDKFVEENGKLFHPRVKKTVAAIVRLSFIKRANRLGNNNSTPTPVPQPSDDSSTNPKPKTQNQESNKNPEDSLGVDNEVFEGKKYSAHVLQYFDIESLIDDNARATVRKHSPSWDFHFLVREYNNWIKSNGVIPNNPAGAFINFVKKKTGGVPPK